MGEYLVIIPCYNEGKNIERVVSRAKAIIKDGFFLIVNDGSTDATSEVAKRLSVEVIDLPFNLGYGAALQTGYKYALEFGYKFAIQLDADGQHDVSCIPHFIKEISNATADIIIGSRFLESRSYKPGFIKKMGILLFSSIVSAAIKQRITDPTSGFQALNKKALQFYCRDVFPSDFPDADMIIRSHFAGLKIKEIPVVMYKSPIGKRQMHSGLTSLYYIFKMFLSIGVTLLGERPEKERAQKKEA